MNKLKVKNNNNNNNNELNYCNLKIRNWDKNSKKLLYYLRIFKITQN